MKKTNNEEKISTLSCRKKCFFLCKTELLAKFAISHVIVEQM